MRYIAVRDEIRGGYQVMDNEKGKAVMAKPYATPNAAQAAAKQMNKDFEIEDALRAEKELKRLKRKAPKSKAPKSKGSVSGVDVADVTWDGEVKDIKLSRFDDAPPADKE